MNIVIAGENVPTHVDVDNFLVRDGVLYVWKGREREARNRRQYSLANVVWWEMT